MQSLILSVASKFLFPLLLLFSFFILFRGHNEPGGGFIAGLIASNSFVLYTFANGIKKSKDVFRIHPSYLVPSGLLIITISGIMPMFKGLPFMTSIWTMVELPVIEAPGTPFLFDMGIFIIVIGSILTIVFTIIEER